MAGKEKYAQRMAKHLGSPIDAACPITSSANAQMGASVGGVVGAIMAGKGGGTPSDVEIGQFAWLGLGPDTFSITNASFSGKPAGEPLVTAAYRDIAAIEVTESKLSLRAEVGLADGRVVVFEAKRQGANKANADVVAELQRRAQPG